MTTHTLDDDRAEDLSAGAPLILHGQGRDAEQAEADADGLAAVAIGGAILCVVALLVLAWC